MSTVRERVSVPINSTRQRRLAIWALFVASMIAGSLAVINHQRAVEEQHAADQARLALAEAFKTLKVCLGEKEGVLWIGGELHLCRAVPTGIKR